MAKIKQDQVHLTASRVKILANNKGSYIQFTLTLTFGADEASCTWRNCLCGISKNGPWVMPSQNKHKTAMWNKALCERVIEGFRQAGTLKQIEGTHTWAEDEGVTIEWISERASK